MSNLTPFGESVVALLMLVVGVFALIGVAAVVSILLGHHGCAL